MRAARSILGVTLAGIYALAFVAAYWIYARSPDDFFAGVWLSFAAVPYILSVYSLYGVSNFAADSLGQVFAAAAFCCALAFVAGALIEASLRALFRLIKRQRVARPPA
ncbi:MAG: hypothetical protein E7774_12290 [Bradyrhizobium sp.]|nr:MAG: hypothetical protein E7774_12290 [Bradyrhizobium sp.]